MSKNKKKDFGWVIQNKKTGKLYRDFDGDICSGTLSQAEIISTRDEARKGKMSEDETILKVSLTKTGKAKKIIGRRGQ